MSDISLGRKLTDDGSEVRDAVHVAVIKARAGVPLNAGDCVTIENGEAWIINRANAIGVVDPFLETRVKTGEHFLVVLLPGSVTNLRHQWSHPLLPEKSENGEDFYRDDDEYDSCRGC